jgi:peptidoglycan-N-acetylglucosamine deacetylase
MSRYQPSAGITASAALHLGAMTALGAGMPWVWPVSALVANHALLTAAGLWPRSRLLGANQLRLSKQESAAGAVALTIDDGPNPDFTPQVLDILDSAKAKATFFCIGAAVEKHPHLAKQIIARGHTIQNHSYAHRHDFSLSGPAALKKEISHAQAVISQITGTAPSLFRAPAGLRNPFLDPVLQALNLRLVSWTRRGFDTVTTDPRKVQARLEADLKAGDILLLHDGHCAVDATGKPVVLTVLPALLATIHRMNLTPVPLH